MTNRRPRFNDRCGPVRAAAMPTGRHSGIDLRWCLSISCFVIVLAVMCTSCTFGRGRQSERRWPKIDWDVQTPVLDSRRAWDDATGRRNEYDGNGSQLAH